LNKNYEFSRYLVIQQTNQFKFISPQKFIFSSIQSHLGTKQKITRISISQFKVSFNLFIKSFFTCSTTFL
jgi:hypothetical protein